MPDRGVTHLALTVSDSARSQAFYEEFAGLTVVHRRPSEDGLGDVLWLGDGLHPFVLVLLPIADPIEPLVGPLNHLGVACDSQEEVDRLCATARERGIRTEGPQLHPPPVGYWAILNDPDGHALELSYGQDVDGLTGRS